MTVFLHCTVLYCSLLYNISDPQWASFNIGVFLCDSCAGIHKSLGTHISMIKSVRLDRWDDIEIKVRFT